MATNEARLRQIKKKLRQLSLKRKELLEELRTLKRADLPERLYGKELCFTDFTSPEGRIKIFLELFSCRKDIYPRYWENHKSGKKGFSPVCSNEWVSGLCKKPKIKCSDCPHQAFLSLDEIAAKKHLQGKELIGSYAIRPNESCIFLAADFDKSSWKEDILTYKHVARTIGVDVALERSRSGNGGHAWIFFTSETPAYKARQLGSLILSLVSLEKPTVPVSSYDRFFPSQDVIPNGGFGNLIALPLQRLARNQGNSVFIDENFKVIENQWKYLCSIKRLSQEDVELILARHVPKDTLSNGEVDNFEILEAEAVIDVIVKRTQEELFEDVIDIELGAQLSIDIQNLPSKVFSALKRSATFANPEFFKLQKMRFSTWKTPRYIFCGDIRSNKLILPRGNLAFCQNLANEIGAKVVLSDQRPKFKRKRIKFTGELRDDQKEAVKVLCKHDFGVLVAPPGVGKTVIGCQMIAKRKVSTLILVHRRPLMDQWVDQIEKFTDIPKKDIGTYGGSRKKPKGKIDIAMLPTLSNLEDPEEFLSQYGQIIIDECHHIPAVSFEELLKKIPARYFLGLTATPVRKDGLQSILYMQCGLIRHEMEEFGAKDLNKKVIVRETSFSLENELSRQTPIHEIWEELIKHPKRLEQIAQDVQSCIEEKAYPLVVSDRKEHLTLLLDYIMKGFQKKVEPLLLVGDLGKKKRKEIFSKVHQCVENQDPFFILSTGSLIGEGVDLPMLNRLILAMPISFKGRLKQYVGRIHRPYEGKKEVCIYDYLDPNMGLTVSMFKKRLKAYKELGYRVESSTGSKSNRLICQADLFSEFRP